MSTSSSFLQITKPAFFLMLFLIQLSVQLSVTQIAHGQQTELPVNLDSNIDSITGPTRTEELRNTIKEYLVDLLDLDEEIEVKGQQLRSLKSLYSNSKNRPNNSNIMTRDAKIIRDLESDFKALIQERHEVRKSLADAKKELDAEERKALEIATPHSATDSSMFEPAPGNRVTVPHYVDMQDGSTAIVLTE